MTPAIELDRVSRDFGIERSSSSIRAVDGLSLRVEVGEVLGLLGPNGSGKSTTLNVILGLLAPSRGRCRVFGFSAGSLEARKRLGYVPEAPYYYRHLSAREFLRFCARLCQVPTATREKRMETVLAQVGLTAAADRRIGTFSKGMLQRIGLAQALVHDPCLIILDEPSAGLDTDGVATLGELIATLRESGKTVVLTSHVESQVDLWCDRVAVLDRGHLSFVGTTNEFSAAVQHSVIIKETLADEEQLELERWMIAHRRRWQTVSVRAGELASGSRACNVEKHAHKAAR